MNFLNKINRTLTVVLSLSLFLFLFLSLPANALVEYDQDVTNEVIFGSGNSNGSFTTDRRNGVEVGLRAKIPFVGTTNSNGDGTYSYTLDETYHGDSIDLNRWNFEFTVNTDYDGSTGNNIDQYTYELGIDADSGDGTNFLVFDPITQVANPPFYDHSLGDNSTANGAGSNAGDSMSGLTVAQNTALYADLISNNNVLQQSWYSLIFSAFPPIDTYNPNSPGTYDVYLIVKLAGIEVARTDIKVIINDHLVTPDVIFGGGNLNGNFTLSRNDSVEVGLRAKIPFIGLTHYDGDHTYSYTVAETYHGDTIGDRNRWNFDFSINTDFMDATSSGLNVDDFTYELGVDADPSLATNFLSSDPITPIGGNFALAPDHSFGDNLTANGGGNFVEGLQGFNLFYVPLYESNNVVQNSSSYAFLTSVAPMDTYDPTVPGTYDIYLIVKVAGVEVARTDIRVLIDGGAPNEAPVTNVDSYTTNEDTLLVVSNPDGVLANDTDVDGDTLQVVEVGPINANGGTGGSITMAAGGIFNYTPPADFNGDAVFDFTVTDGSLTTASSLTITVNSVNDTPSFVKGVDEAVLEDVGAQTVAAWATSISTGAANESAQVLTFNVSNNNTSLFSSQPIVDETSGDLTYTPAANAHGMATVTVNLSDDGGGLDTTADQTFAIIVTPVNDAPTFDIQGDKIYYSLQNNQLQIANYTSNIVLEPNGEPGQAILQYNVSVDSDTQDILNDTNGATVGNNGALSLDFNINNFGTAILTISLQDNAGGDDTSAGVSFNISHLKDAMFSDGFEEIVVIKVFELITESYNNPMFDSLPIQDLPYYDNQSDSIIFLGHKIQLKGDYASPQISKVLQNWIKEVMALEKAK